MNIRHSVPSGLRALGKRPKSGLALDLDVPAVLVADQFVQRQIQGGFAFAVNFQSTLYFRTDPVSAGNQGRKSSATCRSFGGTFTGQYASNYFDVHRRD